jgi:hypothetical protein
MDQGSLEQGSSYPNADDMLSAFANLLHVCCREKRYAAKLFDRKGETFISYLTLDGETTWIEAPRNAPDIIRLPVWFPVFYQKMRKATRTNGFEMLSAEELSMLTGFAPNGDFPFAPMFQFSTNYCLRPFKP